MVAINVVNTGGMVSHPAHKPVLNWYIYLLATMAVIGGFLFGYDTGIVSSAFLYVSESEDMKPMSIEWRQVIISITPGMAGVSALMAGMLSDMYGRRRMIIVSSMIFVIGALICSVGISKYILLFGRILLGIAIGIASMIVPIYVGEASPAHIRGTLVTGFQLMITFGLMASNIIAGGFSYIYPESIGWRLMFGFAALPAIIQFIGFMFLPESPRWLYENEGRKAAEGVLKKIYNNDAEWIDYELEEIQISREQQISDTQLYGDGNIVLRILSTPPVRRALIVGCLLQSFQQISGINTIMYYTSEIIRSAGIRDNQQTIWISVVTSGVNFLCTFIPMYLVERLGRRKLLMTSVSGVILSLLFLSGAFYMINLNSADTVLSTDDSSIINSTVPYFSKCSQHSNCDFCVTSEDCGFCSFPDVGDGKADRAVGYCFPADLLNKEDRSTTGYCSAPSSVNESRIHIYHDTHYEWAYSMCKTPYTFLPIFFIVVYLCSFSIGYAPLPWVLNAEFYPSWARSTCVSISTCFNWTFNLIVSLTFLSLTEVVNKYGAFLIYAVVTSVALVFFAFAVPETKGCSLDEVELLFMSKAERARARETTKTKHPYLQTVSK